MSALDHYDYHPLQVAKNNGYGEFYMCTDHVTDGTMGQHYVNLDLVLDTGAPDGPGLTASDTATIDSLEFAPRPTATVAPAPCATIETFEPVSKVGADTAFVDATATSTCPPITLSAINQPWTNCPGFCIPVPITEEERWARHRPVPKGFKAQQKADGVAE